MIRKSFSFIICCFIGLYATGIYAQVKVDPYLEIPLNSTGLKASTTGAHGIPASNRGDDNGARGDDSLAEVFIKTADIEATRVAIFSGGGFVHTVAGDIVTASVPAGNIAQIADGAEIVFVEAAKPTQLKNDVAVAEINASEVHNGTGLNTPYFGKGVIVGIVDTGIDYRHEDFRDANGNNRILSIWSQTDQTGPIPAEIENGYGTECPAASIADESCRLLDTDGHGTHVSGIAAGRNATYGGVASDANIIVVSYDASLDVSSGYANPIFSTKICDAAAYIFKKANALGKPAVVNLSLGTHIGAHDGSSLFEQCLAGLVRGVTGRAIVAAAGNEYSVDNSRPGIHSGFSVNGTAATNFVIEKVSRDKIYYADIWGSKGANFSVGLALHNGAPEGTPIGYSELVAAGETKGGNFVNGGFEYLINSTETESALNGKQHIGIRIRLNPSIITQPSKYSFDIVLSGQGSLDAWLFPDKPTKTIAFTSISGSHHADWNYVAGDSLKTIAIPATATEVVAVAGYTTRNSWSASSDCCLVTLELGKILDFSSSGPTADPTATGIKPDLTAPGAMIASAFSTSSSLNSNSLTVMSDGKHILQAGTSMAAPFVTGTVALMFEANPNFTSEDVRKYLTKSAYSDEEVGQVPNYRWGNGKLDALAAVETAVHGGASSGVAGTIETPGQTSSSSSSYSSSSSGGCELVAGGGAGNLCAHFIFMLFSIALLLSLRGALATKQSPPHPSSRGGRRPTRRSRGIKGFSWIASSCFASLAVLAMTGGHNS